MLLGKGGVDPQMNKFEQVSIDHHQMSVAGGLVPVWCPGGVGSGLISRGGGRSPCLMFRGVVPYHRAYLMMHLMSPNPNSPCGQTDACEDITFPQLNLWAVKMITEFPRQLYITYFYRPPTTLRWSNLFNHVYVCLSICLRGMGSPRLPEAVQTCSPEDVLPGTSPYRVPTTHTTPGTGWKVGGWYSTEMLCYINLAPQIDE